MEMPVKVLQVLDFINYNSGVSAVVINYYFHMDHTKVQCDFMLYENPERELEQKLLGKGAKIYVMGKPNAKNIKSYQRNVENFFLQYGKEYKIVHVHIPNAAFIVLRIARKYDISVRILHSHNARGADGLLKTIRNFLLNKWGILYANKYYACGKAAGEYLYGKKKMNSGMVQILNNAIDMEKYKYSPSAREKIRQSLGIKNEFLLGHVGRFEEQKNHQKLLDIFVEAKKSNLDCKLVLLGNGSLIDEIRKKALELGISDSIIFEGVVSNVEDYMNAMDVFLLPSLYEGLPVVCVEAQATGLPCLVSTNVTHEIKLTKNVYFLEFDDVELWARMIKRLIDQHINRAEISGMDAYNIGKQAIQLEEKYLNYGLCSNSNVYL